MPSPTRTLANFVNCFALFILLLLVSGPAAAQSANEPVDKSKVQATPFETANATPVINAVTDRRAAAEPVKSEAELMNAARDTKGVAPKTPAPQMPVQCKRWVNADVVALPHPIMVNRLGAAIPDGLIFALASDTVTDSNGQIQLKPGKRPRPLVLRANVGDCLKVALRNAISGDSFTKTVVPNAATGTTEVSLHIQGMEWVTGPQDDGSFVGRNNSSLASAPPPPSPTPSPMPPNTQTYTLFAREEGTFLMYTMGDTSTTGNQLVRGLFGALNVEPAGVDSYGKTWEAEWYRSQVTADDLKQATYNATSLPAGLTLQCDQTGSKCTLTNAMKHTRVNVIKTSDGSLNTADNHPLINYDAKYADADGTPILKMLDAKNNIVHSDLTAIITGPEAGRFPGTTGINKPEANCNAENSATLRPPLGKTVDPLFCLNPALPDRKQPYREITVMYHGALGSIASQAFAALGTATDLYNTTLAGQDSFGINYGFGGIGAEILANRFGVGPMGNCVDCKYEEFFLSAWSVGDPAMLVDYPANTVCTPNDIAKGNANCLRAGTRNPTTGVPYTMTGAVKATKAFFSDDPSNVYHSYINDHVKFRILHGGRDVTHVHHQHAHQWLQSPNSDESSYLDSQMISPGASYTLEMVYNGSGNRNKVVGDSIFHCHFYPHFAAGMWAMWRTHDVFESGSALDADGKPKAGERALPDGEIVAGTPIPAIVPLPTIPMAPLPTAKAEIVTIAGQPGGQVKITGDGNPGYPFFIPGIAGARAPHPPLDFACTQKDANGKCVPGTYLDGGLPRHVVTGGSIKFERHTKFDWSKDLATMKANQLPEDGTAVEKAAIAFFHKRCYATNLPDGTLGSCPPLPPPLSTDPQMTMLKPPTGFILNGLPLGPQQGAPFADPAVDDNGAPINYDPKTKIQKTRIYKAAAIQVDVTFNKQGWHYPQQRMLTLWGDVAKTFQYKASNPTGAGRKPEPLFFRANSGDIVEYWHTNLVPNYYAVDDFQVRTPTDIIGQHIHLVKFDVTSSDGAGNGFNYEDGTFSPEEVQEIYEALGGTSGTGWTSCAGCTEKLREPQPPPAEICAGTNPPAQCKSEWLGAQTTIQRWYLDPQVDDLNKDRTMRTVFTHDHFGPSTHQQAGLYAGLVVEPRNSKWTSNDGAVAFGNRSDGGPTSWEARIITENEADSYREFLLEFQDLQLAYQPVGDGPRARIVRNPTTNKVELDRGADKAVNPPSTPSLVSTGFSVQGTQSVNYANELISSRLDVQPSATGIVKLSDLSYLYDNTVAKANNPSKSPDPFTPLMRAYQNDKVQVRLLVGAHVFAHQFDFEGPTWLAEPSWKNSGYRSAQMMGLSEHFELLFNVPPSSAPSRKRPCPDGMSEANCTDYLYSPSFDQAGLSNGMWGLFRSYSPTLEAKNLKPLPNNKMATVTNSYLPCPDYSKTRVFNITAVTAQKALSKHWPMSGTSKGQLVFNDRGFPSDGLSAISADPTANPKSGAALSTGIMYVRNSDLDANGLLNAKAGVPIEPLILRANAGDCIEVNLTNAIDPGSDLYKQDFQLQPPFGAPPYPTKASLFVGLHPQLLAYDASQSYGFNVGWNREVGNSPTFDAPNDQAIKFGETKKYEWYAGKVGVGAGGKLTHTPVEYGSLNLFPSDPFFQNINGLFGQMIIEPAGSTWRCGEEGHEGDCDGPVTTLTSRASATVTRADGTKFRDFAVMISDSMIGSRLMIKDGKTIINNDPAGAYGGGAVNYRSEPQGFRYPGSTAVGSPLFFTGDFSCMASNSLIGGPNPDPKTPIFTASPGFPVRFRMAHPFGNGASQVITVNGHVWQRNPYTNDSRQIGNNNLSQWVGSRDNHASSDHFDLVIDKAGGERGKAGDYLYIGFVPIQAKQGAWGVFRVQTPGTLVPRLEPNAACKQPAAKGTTGADHPGPDVERFRQPRITTKKP